MNLSIISRSALLELFHTKMFLSFKHTQIATATNLMKLDSSEKFLGKILHPSKQSLSQIEYNEIELQCHNVAIIL